MRKGLVLCGGCFDLIHTGHIRMLQRARYMGEWLIVALNSDSSIRGIKGEGRPIIPQEDRKLMLEALRCVDYVEIFDEPDPLRVIMELEPEILVKGSDWADKYIIGSREVESWGGRVEIVPLEPGYSTTALIERIRGCNLHPGYKKL
jgi:D-beta-D-heptose 7-phosphate kinase/D-beta-D-heptose 1-phosphate adenosyltransferase